jgi:hypothetical protein
MKRLIMFILILILLADGRVIVVPDSIQTITGGLNAAGYGDTVLVKPGEYIENITWPTTDGIKLYSANGPDTTIINGDRINRVIDIGSNITRATEIKGFEISGGAASQAAGIYCQGSPSIIGNKIKFNTCNGERNYGGGIFCDNNTSPLIMNNEITDNICTDSATWNYGAGIYVDMYSTAEICYNLISRNTCSKGYWNYGAGIYVGLRGDPFIYQNLVLDNYATDGERGHGAGIYVDNQAHALIFSNIILMNHCTSRLWNYGAGIKVSGNANIINNTIVDNACSGGSWNYGGGIYIENNDTAWIKNNIIVQNSSSSGSGIYCNGFSINSYNDVWNNIGGNYFGCSPGPGDISEAPLFVAGANGLYYLSQAAAGQPQTSPCVDAGDTLLASFPLTLDSLIRSWTTRTDSVPDLLALDMGYHYPTTLVAGAKEIAANNNLSTIIIIPNPFHNHVTLKVPKEKSSWAKLEIFDVMGRFIYNSDEPIISDRKLNFIWNGRDNQGKILSGGVYFFRLNLENALYNGRFVKLN